MKGVLILSLTEFVVRLVAKLLLIASVFVLIIGGFAVEGDMTYAVRMFVIGICMAAPDLVISALEYMGIKKE